MAKKVKRLNQISKEVSVGKRAQPKPEHWTRKIQSLSRREGRTQEMEKEGVTGEAGRKPG